MPENKVRQTRFTAAFFLNGTIRQSKSSWGTPVDATESALKQERKKINISNLGLNQTY